MTRDEILAMPAGREMDALVAEKVMGWKYSEVWGCLVHPEQKGSPDEMMNPDGTMNNQIWVEGVGYDGGRNPVIPAYTTDISAAWEVVEKMKMYGPGIRWDFDANKWFCALWYSSNPNDVLADSEADTAPLAICRAALLAVMGK